MKAASRPQYYRIRRMVQTCHLLAYHGNWYVFAWNAAKERIATFALSRFRQIESTGARFAHPTDFDPKAYAKSEQFVRLFGIMFDKILDTICKRRIGRRIIK
jgi:predicted DNA-binding transcriptional regulator YafY